LIIKNAVHSHLAAFILISLSDGEYRHATTRCHAIRYDNVGRRLLGASRRIPLSAFLYAATVMVFIRRIARTS
jgi:hypothetical protein